MSGFENKAVLITGTGGGLGREAAYQFAKAGARVFGSDINKDTNQLTVDALKAHDLDMMASTVDLGDPNAVEVWVNEAAAHSGNIDVLINNASAARFMPMDTISVEDWQYTIRNELDSLFYTSKFAWPFLKKNGGVIVNIASVAAHHGSKAAGNTAHTATKGAILAMTRQFALEGAAHKIRAVSISPGVVITPGTAQILNDPNVRQALESGIPVGRAGQPEDIVSVMMFAASEAAAYWTGTDLIVDGGMTAG